MAAGSQFRYYVATVGSIWFVTAVSIATELSPGLKDLIASVFAHHWLGKSILTLVVFGLIVAVTPQRQFDDRRWANYVLVSVIVGSLLILGYFFFHYLST
ncbi:hypothetical protein [Halobacterium wangiae]|uniref:hypothetical protein n=1 Tax=Halobacterium wangiae TaxID=2902623 RepID=UPI001E42DB82|nr:hypothetical protein [Halobacterium wangiae]